MKVNWEPVQPPRWIEKWKWIDNLRGCHGDMKVKVNWKLPQGPRRLLSSCSWKPLAGLWCRHLWSRHTGRELWFPVMIWIFWWKRHYHQCINVIIIVTCWSACNSWGWRSVAILTWPKRRVPFQGWMQMSLYLWQRQSDSFRYRSICSKMTGQTCDI